MAKIKKAALALDIVEAMLPKRDGHKGGAKGWRLDVLKELGAKLPTRNGKRFSDITLGVYFSYALRQLEGRKRASYTRKPKAGAVKKAAPKKAAGKKTKKSAPAPKAKTPAEAAMDKFLAGKAGGAPVAAGKKAKNAAPAADVAWFIQSPDGKKEFFVSEDTARATAAERGAGWTVGADE